MKKARFKNDIIHYDYLADCQRIQRVLLHHGYDASLDQCYRAWRKMSEDTHCAGWRSLPKDDERIFHELWNYLVGEEG